MRLVSQGQKICSESVERNIKHKKMGLAQDEGNKHPVYVPRPSLCHCHGGEVMGRVRGRTGAAVAATRQQDSNVLVSVGHLAVNLSADSRKVTPS